MKNNLIFLSHIHEERELAILIKRAIEDEFGGFVDVFVSSDGVSIPAGANFLKHIEDGLSECIAAIYLISPISIPRNWINFELGAVWIRNSINIKSGLVPIPTLPMCHSGSEPNKLPSPINNLNGIMANQASSLEFSFQSLQSAVGGKGRLKTDFNTLARDIREFEEIYTEAEKIKSLLTLTNFNNKKINSIIEKCEMLGLGNYINIELGFITQDTISEIKLLESKSLKEKIILQIKNPSMIFSSDGTHNGATANLIIRDVNTIIKYKNLLLAHFRNM